MDAAEDVLEMRRLFCDYCGKEISDDKKKRTVTIDDPCSERSTYVEIVLREFVIG